MMVTVKTRRRHSNAYGDRFVKHPGKVYELPIADAETLSAAGLVEPVAEDRADGSGGD